jgi:uncharacterized protein YdhG (YjbR/CyaY superfamily)
MKTYQTIDEYIATFPKNVQEILEKMRSTIKSAAPNATEAISYGIPTFKLNGNLVHFGGYKEHIGFYPAPRGIEAFKNELKGYEGGKGTIKFSLDKPIPFELVAKITKFRAEQNKNKE